MRLSYMPAGFQKHCLKGVHGNAVISAMSAGVNIVVAVPMPLLSPVCVWVVFRHQSGNVVSFAQKHIGQPILAFYDNPIITEFADMKGKDASFCHKVQSFLINCKSPGLDLGTITTSINRWQAHN